MFDLNTEEATILLLSRLNASEQILEEAGSGKTVRVQNAGQF
jgi:hypothetical protein